MTVSFPKFKWDSITVNEISGDPVSQAASTFAKLPLGPPKTQIHEDYLDPPCLPGPGVSCTQSNIELKAIFQPLTTEHGELKALSSPKEAATGACLQSSNTSRSEYKLPGKYL